LRALLGDEIELLAYRQRGESPVLNPDMTVRAGADHASTYGIRCFNRLEEALAQAPDAAFITNPNAFHLPVALAAAAAGCHLFIEKPVADRLEGTEELIRLVARQKLVALVGYQFRFHPGLQLVKSVLSEGRLGNLAWAHIVNGEYLPDWHPYEDYRASHPARRALGGGCLRIQTHELDMALWFFGMPAKVFALGGHLSDLDLDVEDSVSLLLQCGPAGAHRFPVHVHLDYLQRPPQRVCEIVGDRGRLRYDYYGQRVDFHWLVERGNETFRFETFDRNQMFLDELGHFLACMRGEAAPKIDLEEGLRSLRIGLAAERSIELGQPVALT
jgi:predicted dehydrogenase